MNHFNQNSFHYSFKNLQKNKNKNFEKKTKYKNLVTCIIFFKTS